MFEGEHSELVDEVVEGWDTFTETLSGSDGSDVGEGLGGFLEGIAVHLLPMVEHALREGTSGGGGTESLGETEGLGDGEVSLDVDERGSGDGILSVHNTSTLGQALVDTTNGIIRALDLDQEDGLLETRGGGELGSVEDTTGSGDNLTTTSMDSIGVKGHILDVESDTAHVLVGHDTLLGGPLEGSLHGVLDFVEVLNLLGDVNEKVGSGGIGTEAPDLLGIIGIPLEVVLESACALLWILLGANVVILNILGEIVGERAGCAVDTVMLVGGLGKADLGRLGRDGFLVRDNGVTLLDWALGVLLLEILKADLNVELTATGNNVLTGLLGGADDERIGLGELTETLDELGEIGSVLDLDGNTHDGGDGVLHDLNAVSSLIVRDGTLLHEELIDTDKTDGVTARNISDGLDLTAHHEDGSLDVLDVEIVTGSWNVVGSHNSDLLSSGDGTTENTTESVESTLIVGWDHLGDEDHEGTVGVTVLDGLTANVLNWTFVELGGSVLLGSLGGGQLEDDHLKKGLSGVDPLLIDALHEILTSLLLLNGGENDLEGLEHLPDNFEVVVHDVTAELDNWAHDELDEGTLEVLARIVSLTSLELLLGWVVEVVTPELLHELCAIELELLGVGASKLGKSEGPSEKSGTESDGTVGWVDLLGLTHIFALVSGDDDVSVLNNTAEVLVHGLTVDLELEDSTIDLVDHHDGLDLLRESLTEDSLSLHTDTFDVIDDDEGTISDTEGSGDLGGEVNVTWGVNQVDKVRLRLSSLDNIGLVVKGDASGLDGNTTFLFVSTGVREAGVSSIFAGNDTGLCNKGVSQSGLSMVDVSNHRHVTDVVSVVHDLSDLVDGEVGHFPCLEC